MQKSYWCGTKQRKLPVRYVYENNIQEAYVNIERNQRTKPESKGKSTKSFVYLA